MKKDQGYVALLAKSLIYDCLPSPLKKRVVASRLKTLVHYARENSKFLQEYYRDLPKDFTLSDIPITTKQMMMANFDGFLTVRDVCQQDVLDFLKVPANNQKLLNGHYAVAMTSGSTGFPAMFVFGKTGQALPTILTHLNEAHFVMPLATISIAKDFCISNLLMHQAAQQLPIYKYLLSVVDAQAPVNQMVAQLNKFKPKVISGYPNTVRILAEEQKAGRLHIRPWKIITSGERLSENTRSFLEDAFHCKVRSTYACTEGGCMAAECSAHHFHINTDWIILEPVDQNGNPVPPGTLSSKVLMTCLYDYIQPRIRYELTDRIILHTERCSCGRCGPWVEVEGRQSELLRFSAEDETVPIAPIVLPFDEIPGLSNYQLILHPKNHIEMRLDILDGYDQATVWQTVQAEMTAFLQSNGIYQFTMELSPLSPQISTRTGKFVQAYQVDDTGNPL